ncbi:MAG: DUF1810 family protein [Rubrivivax sp.]
MAHPLLGPRLTQCCEILERQQGRSALAIFGSVDELKLRSCLTLERAAPEEPLFTHLLEKYFGGQRDAATLALLDNAGGLKGWATALRRAGSCVAGALL